MSMIDAPFNMGLDVAVRTVRDGFDDEFLKKLDFEKMRYSMNTEGPTVRTKTGHMFEYRVCGRTIRIEVLDVTLEETP